MKHPKDEHETFPVHYCTEKGDLCCHGCFSTFGTVMMPIFRISAKNPSSLFTVIGDHFRKQLLLVSFPSSRNLSSHSDAYL